MNEEQADRVHELKEFIYYAVHDLVDEVLKNEDPLVEEYVRLQLTEQFRFWKRK